MTPDPRQIDFILGIILAVATPLFSHLIITRLFGLFRQSTDRQKGVIISAAFGLLPIIAYFMTVLYANPANGEVAYLPDFIYLLLLYGASAYVYFHFFNMSETSRRVRILVSSGSDGSDTSIIPEDYNPDRMIEIRLERLISLGELTFSAGQYRIGRGLLLPPARIVAFFRQLLFPENAKQTTSWLKIFVFLFATLVLASAMNSGFIFEPASSHYGLFLALACGIIGSIAYALLSPGPCLKNTLLVAIPYLFTTFGFMFSDQFPGRDSNQVLFPIFRFLAEAISNGFGTPTWLPISGGVDIGFFHVNTFPFLPNRLAGYCIAALFPVTMVTAYKIQLVLGVLILAYGWFAVIANLTRSQQAAYWGTMCILLGGTGITFHQEQVITTSHLLPWFTLCLLRLREQRLYILPASALFGLGLSTHYPQIQLISMSLVTMAIFLWQRPRLATLVATGKRYILWCILLILVGSLPSFYIWRHGDELSSPIRDTENLRPTSYADYLELNTKQVSSAPTWYFKQYIRPLHEETEHSDDDNSDLYGMFIGRISLMLCVIALVFYPLSAIPIFILLFIFAELTIGINSHIALPRILFEARFPFINVFRQWYHFFPFVNLLLALLSSLGFMAIIKRLKTNRLSLIAISILLIFINTSDLSYYANKYFDTYCRQPPADILQNHLFEPDLWWQTFQYRDRFKLNKECSDAIPPPLITTAYLSTSAGIDAERALACNLRSQAIVITNTPESKLRGNTSQAGNTTHFLDTEPGAYGASYQVTTPTQALMVSSVNYSLGALAYVDGKQAETWRVNSALSGLLVEPGEHTIEFRKPGGAYAIISWAQIMLYACTALMLMFLSRNTSNQSDRSARLSDCD